MTELKCRKWQQQGCEYQCTQTSTDRCGCRSSILYSGVRDILSGKDKDDWLGNIEHIRQNVQNDSAALVLGAGISAPSKMPMWGPLISNMLGYAIQYDLLGRGRHTGDRMTSAQRSKMLKLSQQLVSGKLSLLGKVNALEAAEYVAQLFAESDKTQLSYIMEEQAIGAMVRKIVDKSLTPEKLLCDPESGSKEAASYISQGIPAGSAVEKVGTSKVAASNTMFAVSYLLSVEKGVRRAMTYNYDPLVQEHMIDLYNMGADRLLTHPGKWGAGSGGHDVREIYHVHGFVPGTRHLERKNDRVFPNDSGALVLSEDSYYRIEREEAYNWSSSIQSHFLNRYHCVFVGFSADDYNFRRILRQMGKDRPEDQMGHYLILTIDDWVRDIYENVCQSKIWQDDTIDEAALDEIGEETVFLLQYTLRCRAAYWSRFNIRPIWVTIKEIPELLTSFAGP